MIGAVPRITAALALCLVPSCANDSGTTTTIAPPARTVHTTPAPPLKWGQVGVIRSGVSVQVQQPVPTDPVRTTWSLPDDAPAGGRRELACDVVVFNGSDGHVRIGVSGRAGIVELIPKYETVPAVAPRSAATVRRMLLAPADPMPLTVQVAATVDGVPVAVGWTFSGGMS